MIKGVKGAIDLVDYRDCKLTLNNYYKLLVYVLLLVSVLSVSVSVLAETDYSTNFALNGSNESSDSQINSSDTSFSSTRDLLIDLQYKSGTSYDMDNDGIEDKATGIVDMTAEGTLFVGDVDESHLCTRWEVYSEETETTTSVCYGADQCCGFVDLQPLTSSWDEVFQVHYGRFDATENNKITAQVIHVDYDLSTDFYDIFYSSRKSLNADFLDISNWKLEIYTDKEYYLPNEAVNFFVDNSIDEASVQMSISDGETIYNVIYTPGQSVEFVPTTLGEYTATVTATLGESVKTKTFEFTVSEDAVPAPTTHRDKVYIAKDQYHLGEKVKIILDIANMSTADIQIIGSNTLYQYNDVAEIFEFTPPNAAEYLVTVTALTPDGEKEFNKNFSVITGPMRINLEMEDSLRLGLNAAGMELYEAGTKANLGVLGNRLDMEFGKKYDLLIRYRAGNTTNATNKTQDEELDSQATNPIQRIYVRGLRAESSDAIKLKIDENINKYNFMQLYAIDPSDMLFDNATITVVAQGTTLYKCRNWSFIAQSCLDGVWEPYMTGLVPGEEYELVITPDDPGFGENMTNGSFGGASVDVTNHTIPGFNILREQTDGMGTNRETTVDLVFWYEESSTNNTIYNISIRENLPDGWNVTMSPPNSTFVNNSLIVGISNLSANSYSIISYKIRAPAVEGEDAFNTDLIYYFNNTWYNTTTIDYNVRVNDSKAFFDMKAELVTVGYLALLDESNETTENREVSSSNETIIVFNVTNIGNSAVPDGYPAIFKWQYNDSMFYVTDIQGNCVGGTIVDWEGMKAIQCEWPTFVVDESKIFNATIYALRNGTANTKFNITYDPPLVTAPELEGVINTTDDIFLETLTGSSIIYGPEVDSSISLSVSHVSNYVAKDIRLFASGTYRFIRWMFMFISQTSEEGFNTLSQVMSGDLSPITGVPVKEKPVEKPSKPSVPSRGPIVNEHRPDVEIPAESFVEDEPVEDGITTADTTPSVSERISQLPQAKKGKRNYPEPLLSPEPEQRPTAIWISTTEQMMLQGNSTQFALYLAPEDPETAEYVAQGSYTAILSPGRVPKLDQNILFNHSTKGKALWLSARFGSGIVDLRDLIIRKTVGKVIVNFDNVTGVQEAHTVYLENTFNSGLYICPDAKEISEIYYNCPNMVVFVHAEAAANTSKDGYIVSIDGNNYKIENITGTGIAQLTILTVQSYPAVGGNWIVAFNTSGTADLTITATNGTTWTNYSDSSTYDLKFLELRCGNTTLSYTWINNGTNCTTTNTCSVYYANYSCNTTTSFETSKVLTGGNHTLKFQFGNNTEYAFNQANNPPTQSKPIELDSLSAELG
jgi:hypothetical protein